MTPTSGKRIALHKLTLTKRAVDALKPGNKPWIAWDDRLTGFGVRVQPSGIKSFIVSYRPGGGRKAPNKRVVLGRHGKIAPERARQMAQQVLGAVAGGGDPAGERAGARAMPLLADAFEDYLAANPDRAPRTVFLYRQVVRLCLDDWLARPLDAIARRDRHDLGLEHLGKRVRTTPATRRRLTLAKGWITGIPVARGAAEARLRGRGLCRVGLLQGHE